MLHFVTNDHDRHSIQETRHSLENLTTARSDDTKHLLLTASGSVATIKLPNIIQALSKYQGKLSIRIILTASARKFLAGQSAEQPTISDLLAMPNVEAVYEDADEWGPHPWRRGASILHIELRRWADVLVISPLSANTMAKIVNGISDSLLTSVVRAWDTDGSIDGTKKVIVVAPAMNSAMWRHPVTAKQIKVLTDDWGVKDGEGGDEAEGGGAGEAGSGGWFQVVSPISKTLACGDTGDGAMASVETIVKVIEERLQLS
ncbi:Flavoprotein [Naviculisporaceae sp. PSN 640]